MFSCNSGYKLIKEKCKKIENSFTGIYNITSITKYKKMMSIIYNDITPSDFEIY